MWNIRYICTLLNKIDNDRIQALTPLLWIMRGEGMTAKLLHKVCMYLKLWRVPIDGQFF